MVGETELVSKERYWKNPELYRKKSSEWKQRNRERVRLNAKLWSAKYRREHREDYNRKKREYERKRRVFTYDEHGKPKQIYGKKRPRPSDNKCELCELIRKNLSYHHWKIENKVIFGLWLCGYCHAYAERYDKGYTEKYEKLKEKAEEELTESDNCEINSQPHTL